MTDAEKQQIQELRINGDGYKAISTVLGVSRDIIRGYCKRNGLDGDSKLISLNLEEKKSQNLICTCCSKPIKQMKHGRIRRFCSEECRRKWWKENDDKRNKKEGAIYKYICPCCKKEFECYGNKKRKYCSHGCYIKSRFCDGDENGGIYEKNFKA